MADLLEAVNELVVNLDVHSEVIQEIRVELQKGLKRGGLDTSAIDGLLKNVSESNLQLRRTAAKMQARRITDSRPSYGLRDKVFLGGERKEDENKNTVDDLAGRVADLEAQLTRLRAETPQEVVFDGGSWSTGRLSRDQDKYHEIKARIDFSKTFSSVPLVTASISGADVESKANFRVSTLVLDVDLKGFNVHRGGHKPYPASHSHDRQNDGNTAPPPTGPYIGMFTGFRDELDEHHDRRERIIKASRDITAASKKMIFALHRLRPVRLPLYTVAEHITAEIHTHESRVQTLLASLLPDLQGINARRYTRQYSPGVQEYLEAVGFRHYLVTGEVISWETAGWYVCGLNGDAVLNIKKETKESVTGDVEMVDAVPTTTIDDGGATGEDGGEGEKGTEEKKEVQGITLTREDYVLGLFDMTGEMMRFAITSVATTPLSQLLPSVDDANANAASTPQMLLRDLRVLRLAFESLGLGNSPFGREAEKKLEVMRESVGKVEYAFYGMVVRGRERPEGWVADAGAGAGGGEE
ncbi:hypothetical protein Dda_8704 [Drechslerella dactyloides]|uniref:H-type lectin domain-containing protein n=1 Tax=Drechslerella dactyloides TaxID=74499 RepID=A0AAD6IQT2_DREDA|nr:hypothetical protein Dda_8704 [Drechslerella dactyloides]